MAQEFVNIRYSFKCRPLCMFSKDHKIQRYIDGTYIGMNNERKYVGGQSPECLFRVLLSTGRKILGCRWKETLTDC